MKKPVIAALVAGQLFGFAPPAMAADLAGLQEQRAGAFGGLRLRVPLDGGPRQRQLRAGFALAPTLQSRAGDGAVRTRIGEGLELGFSPNRAPALTLAGTRIDRLGAPAGRRANVSTVGWIAIGVGATLVVLTAAAFVVVDEIRENEYEG